MSSTNRAKSRPRLSVAMDVDPRDNEEAPTEPTRTEDSPPTARETVAAPSQKGTVEEEESKAPVKKPKRSARSREVAQAPTGDPAIQEINGRIYVSVGDDLMPENARVQMTIALTAIERHRWLQYAKRHNVTLIEVLRRAMNQLLD